MTQMFEKYVNVLDEKCFTTNVYDEKSSQELVDHLSDHLKKSKIFISLSGGVDSMVLLDMFSKSKNTKVYALHINYNNREESTEEAEFLSEYCKEKNVEFILHELDFKRGDIKRNEYEETSKRLRYNLYKEIVNKNGLDGVYVGHHDDDIVENIFNNVMKNNHTNDLSVLKPENVINEVKVFRPFIGKSKNVVYDYAFEHKVPYFKDTTPEWSCRGKMRNNIFPQLEDCYGKSYKQNLMNFSKCVSETNTLIEMLMHNYLEFDELRCNTIMLKFDIDNNVLDMPVQFWTRIFNNICDKIKRPRFSKKAVDNFYNTRFNMNTNAIIMNKTTRLLMTCNRLYMEYDVCEKI